MRGSALCAGVACESDEPFFPPGRKGFFNISLVSAGRVDARPGLPGDAPGVFVCEGEDSPCAAISRAKYAATPSSY